MERIVVLSDMQMPFEHSRAVNNVLRFIKDYKPDKIASVGDEVDFPQISRWTRGMEGEYKGNLQAHVDYAVAFFDTLREFYHGPLHITRSNHMDRPLQYVSKHAPGLMGLKALTVPSLLEFDRLEIDYHEKPYEIAPGWLLVHGDEKGLSQEAGKTAYKAAIDHYGMSVVCGHTHRLGIKQKTYGYSGKVVRKLTGFEVGNLMDLKKATYLGAGSANWQNGFGLLYVEGRHVTPVPITVEPNGSFVVEGVQYK